MLLPSRLLRLPKISENMEISINSPETIKMEADTGTPSIPIAKSEGADESPADQGSSTASSPSNKLKTPEAETEIEMQSLTTESSVGNEYSLRSEKILILSGLWTEQSEKVR